MVCHNHRWDDSGKGLILPSRSNRWLPVNKHHLRDDEDLRLQEWISDSEMPYSLSLEQVSGFLGEKELSEGMVGAEPG